MSSISAREALDRMVAVAFPDGAARELAEGLAESILAAHAHELAEDLRRLKHDTTWLDYAADYIDSEVRDPLIRPEVGE